ncbi:MAG: Glucose-6-phosphate 1-dehydrogenase 2 [Chlamydiae bacterium]|nr:Glucose-6-phosphate 1-dehydrogenase 2 [Chlamydiota bacterium]
MPESSTPFQNPLSEGSRSSNPIDPCILVIFGVTGDLAARKLMPALYNLAKEGQLPMHFSCVGFARREKTDEGFRQEMRTAVEKHSRSQPLDESVWKNFESKLFYHHSEFDNDEGYAALEKSLASLDEKFKTLGNRIYYLATQPSFFTGIIEKLSKYKLIYPYSDDQKPWSRVIIEKPFGHDYQSALALQDHISKFLSEKQIYRIDHYLGKETAQNILTFRFSNLIFEAILNHRYVDHVQITASEDIGIGTRGRFWEETGLLRDMIQSHLIQLMSLIAMEPPVNSKADSIRSEKVKVLEAIREIPLDKIDEHVIRGQYEKGFVRGEEVKGYHEEDLVDPNSNRETFVAMQLFVDNWRWANVPFYLRSGKRLPKKCTEIAIVFHRVPDILHAHKNANYDQNVLSIRIQPNEGISLNMNCKVPGISTPVQPVKMDFKYDTYFGLTPPEAYERLICDAVSGDPTLFAREDEVLTSWKLVSPILEYWEKQSSNTPPNYSAGSWGPKEADELLLKSNRSWRLI